MFILSGGKHKKVRQGIPLFAIMNGGQEFAENLK